MGQQCNRCAQVCGFLANGGGGGGPPAALPAAPPPRQLELVDRKALDEGNKEHRETLRFLAGVHLFKHLPRGHHPLLAAACVKVTFEPGEVVIRQGEPGSEFFVVKRGEAHVYVTNTGEQERLVDTLQAGDYFGETALLRDGPRTATVRAGSRLETLRLTRDKFNELGIGQSFQWSRRKAVGGNDRLTRIEHKKPPAASKTPEDREFLTTALKQNPRLATIASLDDKRIEQLVDVAWKEDVRNEEHLIMEGDLVADFFYIVQAGQFKIFRPAESRNSLGRQSSGIQSTFGSFSQWDTPPTSPVQSQQGPLERSTTMEVITVGRGESFGEQALLYRAPRSATVQAIEDSICWVIDRASFKDILMKASEEQISTYMNLLSAVEYFEPLVEEDKKTIASALVEMNFRKGEVIVQQGEVGLSFYILHEGDVAVLEDGQERSRLSSKTTVKEENRPLRFFGERALLGCERRTASVVVTSETARVLALDKDTFDMLLGPLEGILQRDPHAPRKTLARRPKLVSLDVSARRGRIPRDELKLIGYLGVGGFGAVELREHPKTAKTYALKVLSKGYIVKRGMQKAVISEKEVLACTDSPFIVRLYDCYSTEEQLLFLMEAALGGELFTVYRVRGLHGSAAHAKFYVASVVCAFEHLHERRIVYRDLKPENLLLDSKGYLKVTDMGLAKFVVGKTFTSCGTPDYFAPEVITSAGHNHAVDWWTLGILLFELLAGRPPFEARQPMNIYAKVMAGIDQVFFPFHCQGPAKDLISGLLRREPSERLPLRHGGTANIRSHMWYHGFDWRGLSAMTIEPPFKPHVSGSKDTGNFFVKEADLPKPVPYKDDGSGWDADFELFTN